MNEELSPIRIPFSLLKPIPSSPTHSWKIVESWTNQELHSYLLSLGINQVVALDVETRGSEAHNQVHEVVGVGLSANHISFYFPIRDRAHFKRFAQILQESNLQLIAHNLVFDAAWFIRDGFKLDWKGCTYAWYRSLANEGWAGQKWGLKDAMHDLLGWQETNEERLDLWLINNGHVSNIEKVKKDGYYWIEEKQRWISPKKEEMYQAPPNILGEYCCLDAHATWLLYELVLQEQLDSEDFGELFDEYNKWLLNLILKTIEQQLIGIKIDTEKVFKYVEELKLKINRVEQLILEHPTVIPSIRLYNQKRVQDLVEKAPARLKKDGKVSKNYLKWEQKLEEAKLAQHFNLNSSKQKQWLFYEQLKFPILRETESGQSATDIKALLGFGELGRLFIEHSELTKELGYVEKCWELSKDNQRIHPQLRVPGTLTGRCSGSGGLNIQQLPKSKEYLEAWVAKEGHCWIDFDFTAIEPIVLTELSQDKSMLSVYGPTAGPNDIYLLTGSSLPGLRDKILAAGYNPLNPTVEGIQNAKKKAKAERSVAKIVTLGSNYGMGPKKLMDDLNLHGFPVSFDQARSIHSSYWKLYKGIKDFEGYLLMQWEMTGGWILNGLGRPICVAAGYEKDIVNRVVQSTAHDILMLFLYLLSNKLAASGIDYSPVIIDFHDQCILETKVSSANAVIKIIEECLEELNEKLGGQIKMKGKPQIVYNLAEAKIED